MSNRLARSSAALLKQGRYVAVSFSFEGTALRLFFSLAFFVVCSLNRFEFCVLPVSHIHVIHVLRQRMTILTRLNAPPLSTCLLFPKKICSLRDPHTVSLDVTCKWTQRAQQRRSNSLENKSKRSAGGMVLLAGTVISIEMPKRCREKGK